MREIRCFPEGEFTQWKGAGSWAGRPARGGVEPFWILRAAVEGPIEERTGFLCDIKRIDSLLNTVVLPSIFKSGGAKHDVGQSLAAALGCVFPIAAREWRGGGSLALLQVAVSPFLSYAVAVEDRDVVCITHSFEFSAAHRLHCRDLSDEENRRVFGKCSNPHGHGHNYVLEVSVGGTPHPSTGLVIGLDLLQQVVYECVIHPFDHKNLNVEVADFRSLNPSVENIARVIWSRLYDGLSPFRLLKVRVWETPKTCAEYSGV